MLIKICGITRIEDAQAAVEAGAGAIGFIFWPKSPRFVDPFRARRIAARLPPFVATVGVFVDQSTDHVNQVASLVRLSAVQLHGGEQAPAAEAIDRPVIKAVSSDGAVVDEWPQRVTMLFDAHDPERRGGTGKTPDWSVAARLARRRRMLLAGGLTADNVAAAIAQVRPFGLDVSSGVESAPGIKDHGRLTAFFEAVRRS